MAVRFRTQGSLFLLLTFMLVGAANAGRQLHFQSGTISLEQVQRHATFDARAAHIHSDVRNKEDVKSSAPNYFIIQFSQLITPEDQVALQMANIEVLRFVPDDAYIVRASEEQMREFEQAHKSSIVGYVPYAHNLREAPKLMYRNVFNSESVQFLTVKLFPGVAAEEIEKTLEQRGVKIISRGRQQLTVEAMTKSIQDISSIEGVEWVDQKSRMQLFSFTLPQGLLTNSAQQDFSSSADFSDLTGYESGTKIMNFDTAWRNGFVGAGQIVAVSDTGLDTGEAPSLSPDFSNFHSGFALGYGSSNWADFIGHGTHVTGSVGGVGAASGRKITGGATGASLIMQGLWSQKYQTLTTPEDLGDLFQQAYDAGARVHTNSWGDPNARGAYNTETAAVDEFVWQNPDMIILFAAGNDGADGDRDGRVDPGSVSAPATSKNIISVGASENLVARGGLQRKAGEIEFSANNKPWPVPPLAEDTFSNNQNGMVAFSSRGPTADGRLKPDVVAPGSNILSNCSHAEGAEDMWGAYNRDYCYCGGTSMATPLTAGAAAVVRERIMRLRDMKQPSAALVKAVIMHTAFDMYPGQFGEIGEENGQELLVRGPNPDQGYGRVDVGSAVTSRLLLVDNKEGVAAGEWREHQSLEPVQKVTLVYTDAPAAVSARKALVNNIDLEVVANGKTFTSKSTVNNTEQIVIPEPVYGSVVVRVRGINIPMGKNGRQPYALVFGAAYN